MARRLLTFVVGAVLVAATGALVWRSCGGDDDTPPLPSEVVDRPSVATTTPPVVRPRGGSVRVVVHAEPDPAAPTLTGAAVRALVLPQLFVARPDGTWAPSLVAPGSDALASDGRSATFRLRDGATWSDGTPITVEDLRRSADARFVAAVDAGDAGEVRLTLTQPLPGWRRLWSGIDSVAPPGPGVWGGPFLVAGRTPGLETVLARNDRWWGAPAPWLDEVHLVVVPDATTARLLLARGEVDVVTPPAATNRIPQFGAIDGVTVDEGPAAPRGGWWFGLLVNPNEVGEAERAGVLGSVDRSRFVRVLLRGEADEAAGPAGAAQAVASLDGDTVTVSATVEDPMTPLLERAMQQRVRDEGGRLELRNTETDLVEEWLRTGAYEAALAWQYEGPDVCHRCRWERLDAALATAADAGADGAAAALADKLVAEGVALPLWRPRPVVAWRAGLSGPQANPYALSAAWNAAEWWREPSDRAALVGYRGPPTSEWRNWQTR